MRRASALIYALLILIMAAATFIESAYGSSFVSQWIYGSVWFCALWGALAVIGGIWLFRHGISRRRIPMLLLHVALLCILCGAFITWLCGTRGHIHLRQGEPLSQYVRTEDNRLMSLPFTLTLDSFQIKHYPGTEAPMDYLSHLTVTEAETGKHTCIVSMNCILSQGGYRFYQSSFDEDKQGTWLSVNHDPVGIAVTYTGYALLVLSMLWLLLHPHGGFRRLLRHPLWRSGGLLLLLLFATPAFSQKRIKAVWPLEQADSAASIQVIYNDRVAPFNTLARDFSLKLTGKTSYKGLTPEQLIGSWLLFPEAWKHEPMILVKSEALRHRLGIKGEGKYVRYTDFFDGETYLLAQLWQEANQDTQLSSRRTPLMKAVMEADEKVALITMLQRGELIRPLPSDGSVKPLSPSKVSAELLYNRIPFSKILFMCNLTLGLLTFIYMGYSLLRLREKVSSWHRRLLVGSRLLLLGALLFHTAGLALRCYISGRLPLGNGSETMLFMTWCILVVAWFLRRRFTLVVPFGFMLSGFTLLVAWLGENNPQITPLMPVLLSPWLSLHVSLIMMSYALFAFMALNGLMAVWLYIATRQTRCLTPDVWQQHYGIKLERLALISRLFLYPAVFFLGIGIFVGAVWANVSWGRYWAWDPKEVWALITLLVYAAAFHTVSLPRFHRPLFFHIYMIAAFLTVLMTYFGVNFFLGGMHSYA